MITEQELERALKLQAEIKDMRNTIAKLECCKVSPLDTQNTKISIDSQTIEVNDFTESTLKRFHQELLNDHRRKLYELEHEYRSIIMSPEEAFEIALREDDEG